MAIRAMPRTGSIALAGAVATGAASLLVLVDAPRSVTLIVLGVITIAGLLIFRYGRNADRRFGSEMIRHVSHELRTPLTGLIGALDLLTEPTASLDTGEAAELMGMARSEANNLLQIVENVHAASRLDRHSLSVRRVPVSLPDIVNEAVRRVPAVARRTYIALDADAVVWGDPGLMLQIITNLVQNADRYSPDGEIEVTFLQHGDEVTLHFSDDGPGVALSDAENLLSRPRASVTGLGLGLPLSRRLARAMGGNLAVGAALRSGTTFVLTLPHSDEQPAKLPETSTTLADRPVALTPRARLLVDMVAALSERSLDRMVAGLQKLYGELLGATGGLLMMPDETGGFTRASSFGSIDNSHFLADCPVLGTVMDTGRTIEITRLSESTADHWRDVLRGDAALFVPVLDLGQPMAVLAIGWKDATCLPKAEALDVAEALAELAAFAIQRSSLIHDFEFERSLRHSVMESLPIAISVFTGDPPRVIDWNRRERDMLRLVSDSDRPEELEASQKMFEVEFADGTPLTLENAPVTHAIRTGKSTGPFLLTMTRLDGTTVTTRTYCAPFFDDLGCVAGAVVTSEELDAVPTGRSLEDLDIREARPAGTVQPGQTEAGSM